MISHRDIIILSSIEWNFLWQGPQEIASRLARAGNRVLYIENTGVRAPKLGDVRRIFTRLTNWARAYDTAGVTAVSANLNVCSPLVLPPFGDNWQRLLNRRVFLPLISRAAAQLQMREPVVITFLPTDTIVDLIGSWKSAPAAVVYYCVADFSELSSQPLKLRQSERKLISLSDLVLTQCKDLASHCLQWTDQVHVIPYGVNLESLTPSANGNHKTVRAANNVAAQGLPRPVIGYVGGLHRHLDLSLLTAMAQARPNWSWICIGPEQRRLGKFARLPNVHLAGEFLHTELAQQIEDFDVGIVPYLNNDFTNTVVPTKINEYLAMGKAVVSTALPAVCDYYHWPGVVVTAEPRVENFISAIEQALTFANDESAKARRMKVAALSDWQARLERICQLIDKAIERKANRVTE